MFLMLYTQGRRKDFSMGGGTGLNRILPPKKTVLIVLISSVTLYVGNI